MDQEKNLDETEDITSWNYAQVWDKFPVPARPTKKEIEYLEKEIRDKMSDPSKAELLILGSTIEYRFLCKRLRIVPNVTDYVKENYDILSQYSKEKFPDEHFMEVDWLKINEKEKYDFILGHRIFNCVPHNRVGDMFKIMHDALKPGGTYFCKGNVRFKGEENRLEEIREKWAFKEDRQYPLFSYLEVELYMHCAKENGYVDYPKARKVINDWHENGKISEEDYKLARILISMPDDSLFRSATKEELDPLIAQTGFKNVEWIVMDEDICSNMPIIKLTK